MSSSPTAPASGLEAFGRMLPFVYAAIFIVAVWLAVVAIFNPHESLLPQPWAVARHFVQLAASGELFVHIGASLSRVLSAWCIAGVIAIPLGLAMGRIPLFERLVDPVIELFRPISPLAWIPLAILWFGIGEFGKIFVVLVGTFFPTLISTVAGVKRIDPVLIHAGQVLGCTDRTSLFRKVVLPAALPNIITGLRISFGTGWAAIIAAELVAARSGLGYLISNGMEILRADKVLVGMAVIGVLGVAFDSLFRFVHRRISWGAV
jgi:ABC-type nitrate/sulfonate/bicarbonate transport system permease component